MQEKFHMQITICLISTAGALLSSSSPDPLDMSKTIFLFFNFAFQFTCRQSFAFRSRSLSHFTSHISSIFAWKIQTRIRVNTYANIFSALVLYAFRIISLKKGGSENFSSPSSVFVVVVAIASVEMKKKRIFAWNNFTSWEHLFSQFSYECANSRSFFVFLAALHLRLLLLCLEFYCFSRKRAKSFPVVFRILSRQGFNLHANYW